MMTLALKNETTDLRELTLDELDQVTAGARGSAAPALAFGIAATAYVGIMFGAGVVLGHIIKGDE